MGNDEGEEEREEHRGPDRDRGSITDTNNINYAARHRKDREEINEWTDGRTTGDGFISLRSLLHSAETMGTEWRTTQRE